ncbi:MAG: EAL domain-containing protein, partial [Myxococcota bacterium]
AADFVHQEAVLELSRKLAQEIEAPLDIDGHELLPKVRIGISQPQHETLDAAALVKNGMSAAAHTSSETHRFYRPAIDEENRRRVTMESALRRALDEDGLTIAYQPKVDLVTGKVVGLEALARWQSPELGRVSPAQFIPVAEASGLIVPLTEWVLAETTRQAIEFLRHIPDLQNIALNVSGGYFSRDGFVQSLQRALTANDLNPAFLQIEITESVLMADVDFCAARLRELKALGVSVALDDFGTGYSSLAYLHRFPIDTLKIDRSFVSRLFDAEEDGQAIVSAIVALARTLNLSVVAEGVETARQVDFLAELGCHEGQGYFFAKPLSAGELVQWALQPSIPKVASGSSG